MYETPEQRAAEKAVCDELRRCWGCRVMRYPKGAPIDGYVLHQARQVALVEIKCKPRAFHERAFHYLDVWKYERLRFGEMAHSAPGFPVVGFYVEQNTNGLFWVPARLCAGLPITEAGRCDRGTDEKEPALLVPNDYFRPVLRGSQRPWDAPKENGRA